MIKKDTVIAFGATNKRVFKLRQNSSKTPARKPNSQEEN